MGLLSYLHISFLTFQATVQVIFICLAGYTCARCGLLSSAAQKHISLLNVNLFTPALIFSKLAPSLSLQKIVEISIIPAFFALSTGVSYTCSRLASRFLRLNEPESNFVTAMSVFGNSNSFPVSLTVALAYTLPNLDWDILDDDSPDKIASRGILYLLVFQQLGQILRWSWGYNTLLRRRSSKELQYDPYSKNNDTESSPSAYSDLTEGDRTGSGSGSATDFDIPDCQSDSGGKSVDSERLTADARRLELVGSDMEEEYSLADIQTEFSFKMYLKKKYHSFLKFMNPPLYAMALAVIVASIPALQKAFYVNNGFTQNTLASAINDLGSVSIPLILVVLGSNLSPTSDTPPPCRNYKKIIVGSLVSRMILPSIILLPVIALCVKYIEISILDDPIFLIVSFILTISPPAIQLSQICQLNELYEKEMAGVLFWGYVVLTLPTTIAIVVASMEVLDWAGKLVL